MDDHQQQIGDNMKKTDFKKMALLGMTGGLLLSSQAQVSAEETTNSGIILAHKCGSGSCNGKSPQTQPSTHSCAAKAANTNTADSDRSMPAMATSHKTLTESELLDQLNDEGKRDFASLDTEGKALALRLAIQGQNKNDAVKAAVRQMADRRAKAAK